MSQSGLRPTHPVTVVNEYGEQSEQQIPGEFPLTIRIDDTEIVTLMTLGSQPEALTLGYVRNQKLIETIEEIVSIHVDWDRELVVVETKAGNGIEDWQEKDAKSKCADWQTEEDNINSRWTGSVILNRMS